MNWINKLYELRAEAILELGRVIVKGYDKAETDSQDMYQLPTGTYYGDFGTETYALIYWDKEEQMFQGKSWDTGEDYWFNIDALGTQTICNLIDFINEPD